MQRRMCKDGAHDSAHQLYDWPFVLGLQALVHVSVFSE